MVGTRHVLCTKRPLWRDSTMPGTLHTGGQPHMHPSPHQASLRCWEEAWLGGSCWPQSPGCGVTRASASLAGASRGTFGSGLKGKLALVTKVTATVLGFHLWLTKAAPQRKAQPRRSPPGTHYHPELPEARKAETRGSHTGPCVGHS